MTEEEIQADRTQVRESLQKAFGSDTKVVGVILEIVTTPIEPVFAKIQEAVRTHPGVVIDSLGVITLIEGPIESIVELVSAGGALSNKEQFKRHPNVEYTLGLPKRPQVRPPPQK
jgi:hypothetical protein